MRAGLIGRFKPVHKGAAAMLELLCDETDHLVIGIGSSNKYDARNPFTADEVEGMIDSLLEGRDNYSVVRVPDFGHVPEYSDGQRWRQEVLQEFGSLDLFVTGNKYVQELLKEDYVIEEPLHILPEEKQLPISATLVRCEMVEEGNWEDYVPQPVVAYLKRFNLVDRFKDEFGEEILKGMRKTPKTVEEERLALQ